MFSVHFVMICVIVEQQIVIYLLDRILNAMMPAVTTKIRQGAVTVSREQRGQLFGF